jgi:hypothetical protein
MYEDQTFYAHQMALGKPLREMPPWPTRRGRPRGPAYAISAAEFEQRVISMIQKLEKNGTPTNQGRVARALNMSLSTLQNYCQWFLRLDYQELVQRARDEARS